MAADGRSCSARELAVHTWLPLLLLTSMRRLRSAGVDRARVPAIVVRSATDCRPASDADRPTGAGEGAVDGGMTCAAAVRASGVTTSTAIVERRTRSSDRILISTALPRASTSISGIPRTGRA